MSIMDNLRAHKEAMRRRRATADLAELIALAHGPLSGIDLGKLSDAERLKALGIT